MALIEAELEARARGAYERGRARRAVQRAAFLPPLAGLALVTGTNLSATLACIGVLTLVVGASVWRGQEYGRGARLGLAAGLAPLVLPLLAQATRDLCSATLCLFMPAVCVTGGLVGGLVLGAFGRAGAAGAHRFWLSAIAVTALIGCVGCLPAGLAGIAGMALGLLAGAAPVLVVRTA